MLAAEQHLEADSMAAGTDEQDTSARTSSSRGGGMSYGWRLRSQLTWGAARLGRPVGARGGALGWVPAPLQPLLGPATPSLAQAVPTPTATPTTAPTPTSTLAPTPSPTLAPTGTSTATS